MYDEVLKSPWDDQEKMKNSDIQSLHHRSGPRTLQYSLVLFKVREREKEKEWEGNFFFLLVWHIRKDNLFIFFFNLYIYILSQTYTK